MASSISDLTRRKALASAAFWKWEMIWRRLINLSCYQNQAIQHHLCDSALIWMWILGTVCQHVKQDQCIPYILLQDHAKHQASWSCKQCKNPWDDEHPAPHQHCKTAPTAFSLGTSSGCQMMNHARDMVSIFQLMAEGNQGDKGQATYRTSRSW